MSGISGWQVFDIDEMREHLADNPKEWDCLDDNIFDKYPEFVTLMFFVSDDNTGIELIEDVKAEIYNLAYSLPDVDLGTLDVNLSLVDDDNWLESWKEFFVPFAVGEKLIIKPPWEEYESNDKIVIDINPGHVFGTGHHETTRMCIEALERYIKPGDIMLDLGCGSGILSIIGIILGASESVAVDHSPGAAGVTYLNAEANGVSKDKLNVHIGDVLKNKRLIKEIYSQKYDCIVANIITGVIIQLSPILAKMGTLKPGGVYISSGIIDDRLDEVLAEIKNVGFNILETITDGGWVCVIANII
jgi:ribosomal protein L11 methyltransferase